MDYVLESKYGAGRIEDPDTDHLLLLDADYHATCQADGFTCSRENYMIAPRGGEIACA